MTYEVIISKEAKREIKALPAKVQPRIYDAILLLGQNPHPTASRKLKAIDGYRLRVGDYRIIYLIEKKILRVIVVKVKLRKDAYR